MRIKVPKEIKVGLHKYSVSYRANLYVDERCFGDENCRTLKIRIEPAVATSVKCITFLHEVLHAIDRNYSTALPDGDLDRMASGIAEFLKDNFDIEFDWSDIKEEK